MEKLKLLCLMLAVFSIMLFACKKKSEPEPTAEKKQTDLLVGTWSTVSVTYKGSADGNDWSNFTLILADKSYTTFGVSNVRKPIWPSTGTWSFKGAEYLNVLVRNDKVEMEIITITKSDLTLRFTYDKTQNGKTTGGIDGVWVFKMKK